MNYRILGRTGLKVSEIGLGGEWFNGLSQAESTAIVDAAEENGINYIDIFMPQAPIAAIEVIFNMFRLKPAEELFPAAKAKDIGILARVPLASGLLTGRYTKDTVFGKEDHRSYNRNGEAFDKGETFSGVDYQLGLQAVEELKKLFHTENLIPYALRWILMHDAVSAVIPGASKQEQVLSNVKAARMPSLTQEQMDGVSAIYDRYIKESVHKNW